MKETLTETLKKHGNLYDNFLHGSISILRVYPYESRVGNRIYLQQRNYINGEDLEIIKILDEIIEKVEEENWNDNKIVVETYIGGWHVFIGFWDWNISIGFSVIPTKNFPRYKTNKYGSIEEVKVR